MNCLVVSPHPDDEVLGVGGTMFRRKNEGHALGWLIVTAIDARGGWSDEKISVRKREVQRITQLYSFTEVFELGIPTTQLDVVPMKELVGAISKVFESFQPNEVFVPHWGDVHSDHQAVFKAVASSSKWFRNPSINRILAYETPSETDFGLNPNEMGGVELKKDNDDSSQVDTDFIPSKSPIIQEFARALVASQSKLDEGNVSLFEKVKICREELVKRIELKEFDNQIGSVQETTKSKQADCVEHALLFASVCRAMDIPTRIALGMIFNRNKEEPEMKFHAWIEFHDGERWVPSDSSDQQFPISIDRIKVLESNFTDPNPYLDILKVYQSMTELEISVLSQ